MRQLLNQVNDLADIMAWRTVNRTLRMVRRAQMEPFRADAGRRRAVIRFAFAIARIALLPLAAAATLMRRLLGPRAGFGRQPRPQEALGVGCARTPRRDLVILGPINYQFRDQRPQALAREFTKMGFRVTYVNPTVLMSKLNSYELTAADGVRLLTLTSSRVSGYLMVRSISESLSVELARQILTALVRVDASAPIVFCQHPAWRPIAERFAGFRVIYDCIDAHEAFDDKSSTVNSDEASLVRLADAVCATSRPLALDLAERFGVTASLIRNAASMDFLPNHDGNAPAAEKRPRSEYVYFGAVAEWFDAGLVEALAREVPERVIRIFGECTSTEVLRRLELLPNVFLEGEVPRSNLPARVESMRVGLMPFKRTKLTHATNPVKLYEYASAGATVVATALPETVELAKEGPGIFVAADTEEFVGAALKAWDEQPRHETTLMCWSAGHSWSGRASELLPLLIDEPLVSVVILMWNKAALTVNCLDSVLHRSGYGNLEVILVDNASDAHEWAVVSDWLAAFADPRVVVIRNAANVGFSAGNNAGIQAAAGELIVLLNNDTEVLPGWINRAQKLFRLFPEVGLLGPSTDNIGNEGRVRLAAGHSGNWMACAQEKFGLRAPTLLPVRTVAFFCVFIPRKTYEAVGLLDEAFGIGMFEDDDYCRRVEAAGFKVAISRDIFVHHEQSASFSEIHQEEYEALFEKNRAIYESKWGTWVPHVYGVDADAWVERV